jgi:hypothetical protein
VGTWDADNTTPVLTDAGAAGRQGQFYFVSGAPTATLVQYAGLFNGELVTVVDGNYIVSVNSRWIIVSDAASWDGIAKPQVITDYVNGTIIAHNHSMSQVIGLNEALDAKFDQLDTADHTIPFNTVPDQAIVEVEFLKTHYYTAAQINQLIVDNGGGGGGGVWGTILGDILQQTDLIDYIASQTGDSNLSFFNGLTLNEGTGQVGLGGSALIGTVIVPGGGASLVFGTEESLLSGFEVTGVGFRIDGSTSSLKFESTSIGFTGESESSTFFMRQLGGLVIGSDTLPGSSILALESTDRAFKLSSLADLDAMTVPLDGMLVHSQELNDVAARIDGVWIGLTRPKIIITDTTELLLDDDLHRNAIIIMTAPTDKDVILPASGMSAGFITTIMNQEGSSGTITFVPQGAATLNAFNDTIYVGAATVFQSTTGVYHASGSLGPLVDFGTVEDAIADALQEAKDYTDEAIESLPGIALILALG